MYERYDKNGNFIFYKIAKRVKCIDGTTKYIVATSKTSVRDCKVKFNRKMKEFNAEQDEERRKLPSPEMRFKYFAANWYETNIKYANISDNSKNRYKSVVFNKLIPQFGELGLCEITEDDCQRFLNEYKGYSKQTVKSIRITMQRIFKKALKNGFIESNPVADTTYPEVKESVPRRPLTDKERKLILETAEAHPVGPMVLTMLYAGLRPIEVRRMTWDWIDLEHGLITVGKSKTAAGTGRKIPMVSALKEAFLKEYSLDIADITARAATLPPLNKFKRKIQ